MQSTEFITREKAVSMFQLYLGRTPDYVQPHYYIWNKNDNSGAWGKYVHVGLFTIQGNGLASVACELDMYLAPNYQATVVFPNSFNVNGFAQSVNKLLLVVSKFSPHDSAGIFNGWIMK